jgi:hypothetical protein
MPRPAVRVRWQRDRATREVGPTALTDQGWKENQPVTVISDGDPALPALVGTAAGRPVTHILDWFHISMRVRHIEQAAQGLKALNVQHGGTVGLH